MFIVVIMRDVRAVAIPKNAVISLGTLLDERRGSCCRRSTQTGGNMKANGIAASEP